MNSQTDMYQKDLGGLASHKQQNAPVVSLLPLTTPDNRFVSTFSRTISEQNCTVQSFRWRSMGLRKTDIVFLHWPDEFFVTKGKAQFLKSLGKLAVIQIARLLWSTKFVWVAHNAVPHETGQITSTLRRWFLNSLYGIVYLSEYSRRFINRVYPETTKSNTLVTVHGHYRSVATTKETPSPPPREEIQLVYFGLIRPYKNVEVLVDVVSAFSSGFRLLLAGMAMDRSLSAAIVAKARTVEHIELDLRDFAIDDAELEGIVDSADAVVLPYKTILNSGAALFSLSRSRPVLAPNLGSMPELRENVGHEWVYLYDGDFSQQVLTNFREWMSATKRAKFAPLKAYEWTRVGRDLGSFIHSMTG